MEDKREFLETKARQARELALTVIASFGNGHVGGSMSIMDALAVLFYDAMRLDDQDPDWPHQKLDNLTVLLDYNKGQVDGFVADIEAVAPHEPKWEAFGWDVQRVDGHDVLAAAAAIKKAKTVSGKPQLIVLDTSAGPSSYGQTDLMSRMYADATFAGSSSVPAHVEMMGFIGMGNNPMVGATVAMAVRLASLRKGK